MTWMDHLHALGGAATTSQLSAAGASERRLADAVREGVLIRARRGVYLHPAAGPAVAAAARAGGRLSCVSAARSYGLWGGRDHRLHLRVPPHASRLPASRARRHWAPAEPHPEVWRVNIHDCLRSTAQCADEETAVAVFDTAISARLVTPNALRRVLATSPRRARERAVLARPGSDSGVESIARQRLEALGYGVEQQVAVPGVGRVDMRIDGELFVELDGYAWHADRAAFERDRRRDVALMLARGRRLRFSANTVLDAWPTVLGAIEQMLRPGEQPPQRPHRILPIRSYGCVHRRWDELNGYWQGR